MWIFWGIYFNESPSPNGIIPAKPLRPSQRYDGWQDQRHALPPFHSAQRGRPSVGKNAPFTPPIRHRFGQQPTHHQSGKKSEEFSGEVFFLAQFFDVFLEKMMHLVAHLESNLILGHALNLNFHYQRYQYLCVVLQLSYASLGHPLLQELPWINDWTSCAVGSINIFGDRHRKLLTGNPWNPFFLANMNPVSMGLMSLSIERDGSLDNMLSASSLFLPTFPTSLTQVSTISPLTSLTVGP